MAKVTIKERDLGFGAIMQAIARVKRERPHVVVGITGDRGEKAHSEGEGASVVEIGAVHEFGGGNVPERSFLRATVDENEKKYQKYMGNAFRREIGEIAKTGKVMGENVALKRLGLMVEGDIKKRIAKGINPPLHPLTIARKGSSKPLIDTGQLRASIASEIRKGRTR